MSIGDSNSIKILGESIQDESLQKFKKFKAYKNNERNNITAKSY